MIIAYVHETLTTKAFSLWYMDFLAAVYRPLSRDLSQMGRERGPAAIHDPSVEVAKERRVR